MKGSKLLSDYFIDRKFTQRQKEDMRVVTIGGQIAWLIGERVDARFAAMPDLKKYMSLNQCKNRMMIRN